MSVTVRERFDEDAACALYGTEDGDVLARRFAGRHIRGHWFAYDSDGAPVGIALAAERPDGRVFVTHRLVAETAFARLLETALASIAGPVSVTVEDERADRVRAVESLGLRPELSSVGYDVPFAPLLEALPTRRGPGRFDIVRADEIDPDDLFALDTELRGDTPGNDGWTGNRQWFDDEMTSAEFDATGYHVAIGHETGGLAGLCRMWNNPDGPALGMLGVRRRWRTGFVALGLLRATVAGSSEWGWPTFATHTTRPGLQRHLQRVGAVPSSGFHRFTRT